MRLKNCSQTLLFYSCFYIDLIGFFLHVFTVVGRKNTVGHVAEDILVASSNSYNFIGQCCFDSRNYHAGQRTDCTSRRK